MNTTGHGPNIGNGYVKYVVIDEQGQEQPPVVFPATIAPAQQPTEGALRQSLTVAVGEQAWWIGEDTCLSGTPLTLLSQDRLTDPVFIPALLLGALARLPSLTGSAAGACVTGLPATWSQDREKVHHMGDRIRTTGYPYQSLHVIAEPVGMLYAEWLDTHGRVMGDSPIESGRVGVIDLGHLTVDIAAVKQGKIVSDSLDTFQLGTAHPLKPIRARLSAHFDMDLTLHEADSVVQQETIRVSGTPQSLPRGWDRPLLTNAAAIVSRLVAAWGQATQFDTILIGGGGAEQERIVTAITTRFSHARVVQNPQTAVARGYARLARRIALAAGGAAA